MSIGNGYARIVNERTHYFLFFRVISEVVGNEVNLIPPKNVVHKTASASSI